MYVNEEDDVAVLEDISGRITVKNGPNFQMSTFVSGTILALRGQAISGGYFEVQDFCLAGIPFRDCPQSVTLTKKGNKKRDLYDPKLLIDGSSRQFVALVSGLQIGRGQSTLLHSMLAKFLRGEFADTNNQKLASQITRLVIAGDSMV